MSFGHKTMGVLKPTMKLPKEYFDVDDLMYSNEGYDICSDDFAIENKFHKLGVINERVARVNEAADNYNAAASNLMKAAKAQAAASVLMAAVIGAGTGFLALRGYIRSKKREREEEKENEEAREAKNG